MSIDIFGVLVFPSCVGNCQHDERARRHLLLPQRSSRHPQAVTDSNQQVVWQAEYHPFGEVTETVSLIEQNLRFPGQYFDAETGLHYNYFRDYDPSLGRYVESDPIGLSGGIATYGYAYVNPNRFTDPDGLCPLCPIVHWTRNQWNQPVDFETAKEEWTPSTPEESAFHRQNGASSNRKYTSPYGFHEGVYDCKGTLVEDSLNKGTFNFAPANFAGGYPHAILDILPWFLFGNDPVRMFTNAHHRFQSTYYAAKARYGF